MSGGGGQGRADVYPLHGTMKSELGSLIWPWRTGTLGREGKQEAMKMAPNSKAGCRRNAYRPGK